MNVGRVAPTSFVHENQVFVAGECDNPVIEVLNLNEDPPQWEISEARSPFFCRLLRSIVHQNRVFFFAPVVKAVIIAENSVLRSCVTCLRHEGKITKWSASRSRKVLIFGGESVKNVAANILEEVLVRA